MITEILEKWCGENNIDITDSQKAAFEKYAELLISWNEKMNLTAITEKSEIAVKHFIDSISVIKACDIKQNARIIDIGTGAGFPGIPIKIMRPDIELYLLDSLNKRLIFLDEVCRNLDIKAGLIHARAEEYSQKPEYRETFDISISRAVANLPSLCEYCLPYVKKGGSFISMKGPDAGTELKQAEKAVAVLGGKVGAVDTLILPDESKRTIISVLKVKQTPPAYPRRGQKINKNPI